MDIAHLGKVYDRLGDQESVDWFHARVKYAIDKDPFGLFQVFYDGKEPRFFGSDLGRLKDPVYHNKRFVIFGAGRYGFHTYFILKNSEYADRVCAFAEIDPDKWGTEFLGLKVLSPFQLCEEYKDCVVIIASVKYGKDMYRQLARAGFPQYHMYFPPYGKLMGVTGKQYFDVFEPVEHEVFVDAGCYNGNTSVQFANWCGGNYDKIYAFEPSDQMALECRKTFERNHVANYELLEKICWSEETEIGFSSDYSSMIYGSSKVKENAVHLVPAVAIDDVLAGGRVTFIKMDVEGSELEALKGAQKSIQQFRPRLAISLYHKPEDVFEIPSYILSLVPDYKLYIRHYSSDVYETVLYAI